MVLLQLPESIPHLCQYNPNNIFPSVSHVSLAVNINPKYFLIIDSLHSHHQVNVLINVPGCLVFIIYQT